MSQCGSLWSPAIFTFYTMPTRIHCHDSLQKSTSECWNSVAGSIHARAIEQLERNLYTRIYPNNDYSVSHSTCSLSLNSIQSTNTNVTHQLTTRCSQGNTSAQAPAPAPRGAWGKGPPAASQNEGSGDVFFSFGVIADIQYADRSVLHDRSGL